MNFETVKAAILKLKFPVTPETLTTCFSQEESVENPDLKKAQEILILLNRYSNYLASGLDAARVFVQRMRGNSQVQSAPVELKSEECLPHAIAEIVNITDENIRNHLTQLAAEYRQRLFSKYCDFIIATVPNNRKVTADFLAQRITPKTGSDTQFFFDCDFSCSVFSILSSLATLPLSETSQSVPEKVANLTFADIEDKKLAVLKTHLQKLVAFYFPNEKIRLTVFATTYPITPERFSECFPEGLVISMDPDLETAKTILAILRRYTDFLEPSITVLLQRTRGTSNAQPTTEALKPEESVSHAIAELRKIKNEAFRNHLQQIALRYRQQLFNKYCDFIIVATPSTQLCNANILQNTAISNNSMTRFFHDCDFHNEVYAILSSLQQRPYDSKTLETAAKTIEGFHFEYIDTKKIDELKSHLQKLVKFSYTDAQRTLEEAALAFIKECDTNERPQSFESFIENFVTLQNPQNSSKLAFMQKQEEYRKYCSVFKIFIDKPAVCQQYNELVSGIDKLKVESGSKVEKIKSELTSRLKKQKDDALPRLLKSISTATSIADAYSLITNIEAYPHLLLIDANEEKFITSILQRLNAATNAPLSKEDYQFYVDNKSTLSSSSTVTLTALVTRFYTPQFEKLPSQLVAQNLTKFGDTGTLQFLEHLENLQRALSIEHDARFELLKSNSNYKIHLEFIGLLCEGKSQDAEQLVQKLPVEDRENLTTLVTRVKEFHSQLISKIFIARLQQVTSKDQLQELIDLFQLRLLLIGMTTLQKFINNLDSEQKQAIQFACKILGLLNAEKPNYDGISEEITQKLQRPPELHGELLGLVRRLKPRQPGPTDSIQQLLTNSGDFLDPDSHTAVAEVATPAPLQPPHPSADQRRSTESAPVHNPNPANIVPAASASDTARTEGRLTTPETISDIAAAHEATEREKEEARKGAIKTLREIVTAFTDNIDAYCRHICLFPCCCSIPIVPTTIKILQQRFETLTVNDDTSFANCKTEIDHLAQYLNERISVTYSWLNPLKRKTTTNTFYTTWKTTVETTKQQLDRFAPTTSITTTP